MAAGLGGKRAQTIRGTTPNKKHTRNWRRGHSCSQLPSANRHLWNFWSSDGSGHRSTHSSSSPCWLSEGLGHASGLVSYELSLAEIGMLVSSS
eukprot:671222-Amphidinium_carterae.1